MDGAGEDDDLIQSEADALVAAKAKKIEKLKAELFEQGIGITDEMIARLLSAPKVRNWRPSFGRERKSR